MIEDKKVISKLNGVIEECKRELEERIKEDARYSDLIPKLEKVVKNCEASISLVKEYEDVFNKRAAIL
jgi:hypothetical protein